jgi:hypothetical protein
MDELPGCVKEKLQKRDDHLLALEVLVAKPADGRWFARLRGAAICDH